MVVAIIVEINLNLNCAVYGVLGFWGFGVLGA
jgi:hypothetical protein